MDDHLKSFEHDNIKKLQDERVRIQKKTFTNWINSHLKKVGVEVKDLFKDLCDGKVLIRLMEVISDVKLGKPNRGSLRVQKIENVNKALQFIRTKVQLENIGAEDIVDGNERLILGLVWTIILRFQIQEMMIQSEENEKGEKKSAKDALLLWCQNKTRNYDKVNIKDFSKSWRDGLGFNALIHAHCPDLVDYDKIVPENHKKNLTEAFTIADKELGVPSLLDPEDIDVDRPDDKSIMTYVAQLYMTFAKMKTESTGAKRINKIVSNALEVSKLIENYEKLVRDLLQWIQKKIQQLNNRQFPNSLEQMQSEMHNFKEYRTVEKPPKFAERASVDEKLFQILLKQKQNNMKNYMPPEGLLAKEVEVAWVKLEKAEHAREMALREEILRQEKLQQAAEKFKKKASLREAWLTEMFNILASMEKTKSKITLEALINKKELLENDVCTKKERFTKLDDLTNELDSNKYHAAEPVIQRNAEIQRQWKQLQNLVGNKQSETDALELLCGLLRSLSTIKLEYEDLEPQMKSTEFGKHLMAAEDLLERHNLLDSQLKGLIERFRKSKYNAEDFLQSMKSKNLTGEQHNTLKTEISRLDECLGELSKISQERRKHLLKSCEIHRLMAELEEEESWITDHIKILSRKDVGNDLPSVLRQINRHQIYESEIEAHMPTKTRLENQVSDAFPDLNTNNNNVSSGHFNPNQVIPTEKLQQRLHLLNKAWQQLQRVKTQRRLLLKDAYESQKYYVDADDAQQWLEEMMPLVVNNNNGSDAGSAQALSKRHKGIQQDIKLFGDNDMCRLNELATLMTKSQEKHNIRPEQIKSKMNNLEPLDNLNVPVKNNMIQIPMVQTKTTGKEQEDTSNLVVAIGNYTARDPNNRDISLVKDEKYTVIKRKNDDWWQVETKDQRRGHAPASYLRPLKSTTTPTIQMQWVPLDSEEARAFISRNITRTSVNETIFQGPSVRNQNELHYDKDNIEKRQNQLNQLYDQLVGLSKAREFNLIGSSLCHQFVKDCDLFEQWMSVKEEALSQQDSFSTNVEATKKKYEAIIDDLAANGNRIKELQSLANQINQLDPQQDSQIKKADRNLLQKIPFPVDKKSINNRMKDVINKWDKLNKLKSDTEKNLAGASSIDLFNKTAEELKESILQKLELLNDNDVGRNIEANEALKRKFQNMLREIDQIGNRYNRCKYTGESLKNSHPNEAKYVDEKLKELDKLYKQLESATKHRQADLDNAGAIQAFVVQAEDLQHSIDNLHDVLDEPIAPRDITSVENCIKQYAPVKYDIVDAQQRLGDVKKTSMPVLSANPNNQLIPNKLKLLADKMDALSDKAIHRDKELQDHMNTQRFMRDCDQVEAKIGQQNYKLDIINPEPIEKEVQNAQRNLDDIDKSIEQLTNRINEIENNRNQLQKDNNPDIDKIKAKENKMKEKIKQLKDKAKLKRDRLDKDLNFSKFKIKAEDLNEWIDDKMLLLSDDDYKELINIEQNIKKHRAFEEEIKANTPLYQAVNKDGQDLIKQANPHNTEIKSILDGINDKWSRLSTGSDDKEKKFAQAEKQRKFNENIDEINQLHDNIQNALKASQLGNDLTSAKRHLDKHNDIETELEAYKAKLAHLKDLAAQMAGDDHFNKDKILQEIQKLQTKCELLEPMVNERRKNHQDNLKWHQFAFDVDQELQWIEDHRLLASKTDYGRSFDEAIKLSNKSKKLSTEIQTHKPSIDRLLEHGKFLKSELSPNYHGDIDIRMRTLSDYWTSLEQLAANRRSKLDLSQQGQQMISDFGEIDTWIIEHSLMVEQINTNNLDADQVASKTAKLNNIKRDLNTYQTLLKDKEPQTHQFIKKCTEQQILPELVECVNAKYRDVFANLCNFRDLINNKLKLVNDTEEYQKFSDEVNTLNNQIDEIVTIRDPLQGANDLEETILMDTKWENNRPERAKLLTSINEAIIKADKLIDQKNPFHRDIDVTKQDLMSNSQHFQEWTQQKQRGLESLQQWHQFNLDCQDLFDRMDLNKIVLPPTSCKDQNTLNSLVKKYDTIESDLINIAEQMNKLHQNGNKLKQTYPEYEEEINNNFDELSDLYAQLRAVIDDKNLELKYTMQYLNILEEIGLLSNYLDETNVEIQAEPKITNVHAASDLLQSAKELKSNLVSREDDFKKLVSDSEDIISASKCKYISEIQNAIDDMIVNKSNTEDQLDNWLKHAKEIYDQQLVLRDVNQLNSSTAIQNAKLNATRPGEDLEKNERISTNHAIFLETITDTDKKLNPVAELLEGIVKQKHFDSDNLQRMFNDCQKRRSNLHNMYDKLKNDLSHQTNWLKFQRDSDDKKLWTTEKFSEIKSVDRSCDDLQEKIEQMQKFGKLQAEIQANVTSFNDYATNAQKLIKSNPNSDKIKLIAKDILDNWSKLMKECEYLNTKFQETKSLLDFYDEVQSIESWLRNKEELVNANQMGRDLPHCESLIAALNDSVAGGRHQINSAKINELGRRADELLKKQRTLPADEASNVRTRVKDIDSRWNQLQDALAQYRDRLNDAYALHKYYSDLCLLAQEIKDRIKQLQNNDLVKDISVAEKLKRKHDANERDVIAIKDKFNNLQQNLDQQQLKLDKQQLNKLQVKQNEIVADIETLDNLMKIREELLNFTCKYSKLSNESTNLIRSLELLAATLSNQSQADNISASQSQLSDLNGDKLSQLNSYALQSRSLLDKWTKLNDCRPQQQKQLLPTTEDISARKSQLTSSLNNTTDQLKARKNLLEDLIIVQNFIGEVSNESDWVSSQMATCDNQARLLYQTTMDNLEEFTKFVKTTKTLVGAKERNVIRSKLENTYKQIQNIKSCDIKEAVTSYENLLRNIEHLKSQLQKLSQSLDSEHQLHDFIQRVNYHLTWLRAKTLLAKEENHKDRMNISNKIHKHQEFSKEVLSIEPDINEILKLGDELIQSKHRATEEITLYKSDLGSVWKQLLHEQQEKMFRLEQTRVFLDWSRDIDSIMQWIEEVEDILSNNDYANDLYSVKRMHSKVQEVLADIKSHEAEHLKLHKCAQDINKTSKLWSTEVQSILDAETLAFSNLKETHANCSRNLLEAEMYFQFKMDLDYEIDWINEKISLMNESELLDTIAGITQQLSKQTTLDLEITARQEVFQEIGKRANELIKSEHYSSQQIREMNNDLQLTVQRLKQLCHQRKSAIENHHVFLLFKNDLADIENRIDEKIILLHKISPGNSEQICEAQIKKLEDIRLSLDYEATPVCKITERAATLADQYQASSTAAIKLVEDKLEQSKEILTVKIQATMENFRFYQFNSEVEDQLRWIRRTTNLLLSDDNGQDYDDCLKLIQNLQKINLLINNNKSKRDTIEANCKKLKSDKNQYIKKIDDIYNGLVQSFMELKSCYKDRKEDLDSALEVHLFDQQVSETVDWINSKKVELVPIQDQNDNQFEASLSFIKKHSNDVKKIERQVDFMKKQSDSLKEKADKLTLEYPDTNEHIKVKTQELDLAWKFFNQTLKECKLRLSETYEYNNWLATYNDLLRWIRDQNQKLSLVTVLPTNLDDASHLVKLITDQRMEKDTKNTVYQELMNNGDSIRQKTTYVNVEIAEKQQYLTPIWEALCYNLETRKQLYEQNLDLRKFLMTIKELEKWLDDNQMKMKGAADKPLQSISDVEEAVKNHEAFMRYVDQGDSKFQAVKRLTNIEQQFKNQIESEMKEKLLNLDGGGSIKRRETQRILAERQKQLDKRSKIQNEVRRGDTDVTLNQNQSSAVEGPRKAILKKQKSAGQIDLSALSNKFEPKLLKLPEDDNTLITDVETSNISLLRKPTSFSTKKKDKIQIIRPLSEESPKPGPAIQLSGEIELKHVLGPKGLKPTNKRWKVYFCTLLGFNLIMYKNESSSMKSQDHYLLKYNLNRAIISSDTGYTKHPHVLGLKLSDQSEIYLKLNSEEEFKKWLNQLQRNSNLTQSEEARLVNSAEFILSAQSSVPQSPNRIDLSPVPVSQSRDNNAKLTINVAAVMDDEDDYVDLPSISLKQKADVTPDIKSRHSTLGISADIANDPNIINRSNTMTKVDDKSKHKDVKLKSSTLEPQPKKRTGGGLLGFIRKGKHHKEDEV